MFYNAVKNDHGLPNDPFKAIVAPRPIGWISSLAADGRANLAPYSFFNAFAQQPYYVAYGSGEASWGGAKDSLVNVEATGEFVVNLATWDLREAMNAEWELNGHFCTGLKVAVQTVMTVPHAARNISAFGTLH